jgi:hypothetical protein
LYFNQNAKDKLLFNETELFTLKESALNSKILVLNDINILKSIYI